MKTITKIALSNNLKNRTRSILIMIAICLMTMLLTIVSSLGSDNIRSGKEDALKYGGSNYGAYNFVNSAQLQEVKKRDEIADIGIICYAGILKGDDESNFYSMDEAALAMLPLPRPDTQDGFLEEGSFPINQYDIAAGRAFFISQGYDDAEIGDTVSLEYRPGLTEKYTRQDFIISGFLYEPEGYVPGNPHDVYCSFSFVDSQIAKEEQSYSVLFTLDDSLRVTMNNVESVSVDIAESCGIDFTSVKMNSSYLEAILIPSYETIAVFGVLILVIVLLSVITIYNIYQVGIAQKIQEYGKIKALGATKKQMKQLIFREGMILAALSLPVGLILGFYVAQSGMDGLTNQINLLWDVNETQSSLFSFPVMIVSACISLFAVILALLKPMRIVSKISPIEATRYLDHATKKNQGSRRGKKNVSVFSIATANIAGNKKAAMRTILTMGLSCLLFVTISNYVGNIDVEYEARKTIPHGQFELLLDYPWNWDEAYQENNLDYLLKDNPLSEILMEQIKSIPGVKAVSTRELVVVNLNGAMETASIVNKYDFENMLSKCEESIGVTDYDEAVKNGNIFYAMYNGSFGIGIQEGEYSLNDPISMELDNGTEKLNYEGCVAGGIASYYVFGQWIIPEEVYQTMQPESKSYGHIWIDCEENDLAAVEHDVEKLTRDTSNVFFTSYHEVVEEVEFVRRIGVMIYYFFMAVVGLIGFMNLSNTIIINVTTKKQEYGVLQALGMTNRQLNAALQLQGLIFTLGTIIVALVVGLPLGYMLFSYARGRDMFGMNLYHVPVIPILLMISVIVVLQIVLSFALSRNLKKETLVERIRYQG